MDKLKGLGNELGVPSSHLDPLRANPVDVVVSIPVAQSVAPLAALYRCVCAQMFHCGGVGGGDVYIVWRSMDRILLFLSNAT